MIKNRVLFIVLGLLTFTSFSAKAQEKLGFHVAADLNFGVGIATQDGDSESDTGLGISLRPGYQLNDEWIVMLDLFHSRYSKSGTITKNNGFMFAGQYYFQHNAYVRPSLGFSKLKSKVSSGGSSFSTETDLGLALGVGAGYEFLLYDDFVIGGPVARVIYNNVNDGGSFWNISLGAEVRVEF